jgi:hypothetical protein
MTVIHSAAAAVDARLHEHLEALAAELRGACRLDRLREIVDEVMRVQAVTAPDADTAAASMDGLGVDPARLGPLRALAVERFATHRRRIEQIRAREASRAGYVAARAKAKPELRRTPGGRRA